MRTTQISLVVIIMFAGVCYGLTPTSQVTTPVSFKFGIICVATSDGEHLGPIEGAKVIESGGSSFLTFQKSTEGGKLPTKTQPARTWVNMESIVVIHSFNDLKSAKEFSKEMEE